MLKIKKTLAFLIIKFLILIYTNIILDYNIFLN